MTNISRDRHRDKVWQILPRRKKTQTPSPVPFLHFVTCVITVGFLLKLEDVYSCPGASSIKHDTIAKLFTDQLRRHRSLVGVCYMKLLQYWLGKLSVLKAMFHVCEVDHKADHQEEDDSQLWDLHCNWGILWGCWQCVWGTLSFSRLSTTYRNT